MPICESIKCLHFEVKTSTLTTQENFAKFNTKIIKSACAFFFCSVQFYNQHSGSNDQEKGNKQECTFYLALPLPALMIKTSPSSTIYFLPHLCCLPWDFNLLSSKVSSCFKSSHLYTIELINVFVNQYELTQQLLVQCCLFG